MSVGTIDWAILITFTAADENTKRLSLMLSMI